MDDEVEFNPYENTDEKVTMNYWEGFINMLKASLGLGIFFMPEAFSGIGWVNGFLTSFFLSYVCILGLHVYFKCKYILCQRKKLNTMKYPQVMTSALESGPVCFRKFAVMTPTVVNFLLVSNALGICCTYVRFVGFNVKYIMEVYFPELPVDLYILMLLIPFILISTIPNMKKMAIFSIVNSMFLLASFSIIFYYTFQDLPPLSERNCLGSVYGYPTFVGTYLFSLETVTFILAIEREMESAAMFTSPYGVLNTSWITLTMIYSLFGFFGYWKYGNIEGSINDILPKKGVLPDVLRIVNIISVFIASGIHSYAPLRIIWEDYLHSFMEGRQYADCWHAVTRICMVSFTVIIAASIAELKILIILLGNISFATLGLLFPAMIDICLRHPNYGRSYIHLWKNMLLLLIAIVGVSFGKYEIVSQN